MLLNSDTLDAIRRGTVSLAFRRWRRPTVRSGGTLMTGAGRLQIRDVRVVDVDSITADDAARAGYTSRETLLHELAQRDDGAAYRVELGELRPDPRFALREAPLDDAEVARVQTRLDRLDAASPYGPWTLKTLRAISEHPGLRAADLCRHVGQELRQVQAERAQTQESRADGESRGRVQALGERSVAARSGGVRARFRLAGK